MLNLQSYGCRFNSHSFHNFFSDFFAWPGEPWVQIHKVANFKVPKHHDSSELSIRDFCHLICYFMEKLLAYANTTLIIAERMPNFYCKLKYFQGYNINLSHFLASLNNQTLFMHLDMHKTRHWRNSHAILKNLLKCPPNHCAMC